MAAVFVAFVAAAAMVTPLARAIRIEPAIALRQETSHYFTASRTNLVQLGAKNQVAGRNGL
jgi:hypothetical protein